MPLHGKSTFDWTGITGHASYPQCEAAGSIGEPARQPGTKPTLCRPAKDETNVAMLIDIQGSVISLYLKGEKAAGHSSLDLGCYAGPPGVLADSAKVPSRR